MIEYTGFSDFKEIDTGPIELEDLVIIDNGDGTWTAIGPEDRITMVSETQFQLEDTNSEVLDANTYKVASDNEGII